MGILRAPDTIAYRNQWVGILSLLHTNPTLQLPVILLPLTNISPAVVNRITGFNDLFVHIFGLWVFVDDFLYSQFYFAQLENVALFQEIPLTGHWLYNQPKGFADFRELIDFESVLFLPELILISELVYIDHDRRHYPRKLRVIGKQGLILIPKLYDSNFPQHDVDDLIIELRIRQVIVKQVVMSFFPALDDQASNEL